jgi:hypothetical protein
LLVLLPHEGLFISLGNAASSCAPSDAASYAVSCARPFVICTILGEDVLCVFWAQIDGSKCWGARDSIALHDSAQTLMLMLREHCVMFAWNEL